MMQPFPGEDGTAVQPATIARAAGYALEQADGFLGKLGNPIGLQSYKPYHSTGEDYLHTYLGMIGIPIDLRPEFPDEAPMVLLTESAAADSGIVGKIRRHLAAGRSVVITSGLLRALQGRGIEDIAEIRATERKAILKGFRGGDPVPPDVRILIPQIQYLTNDTWERAGGTAQNDLGYPLLLESDYSNGTMYVLTIPDNFSDLYSYPTPVLTQIRDSMLKDLYVRAESPGDVSLFVYDNGTFIVESFLPETVDMQVSLDAAYAAIRDLLSGEEIPGKTGGFRGFGSTGAARVKVPLRLQPHSYRVFEAVRAPGKP